MCVLCIVDHGTLGAVCGVRAGAAGRGPGRGDRGGNSDGGGDDTRRPGQPRLRDQGT